MKIGHVFKLAQDSLWGGVSSSGDWNTYKFTPICFAITSLLNRGLITRQEHEAARKVIRERLGGHALLERWLADKGVSKSQMTRANLQAHRLAWLKKLNWSSPMNPKVELLTSAKYFLWDGVSLTSHTVSNICAAVSLAHGLFSYRDSLVHAEAKTQIFDKVSAHISPCAYFSTWYIRRNPNSRRADVQKARHEFVDQLIKEFSNEREG